MMNFVNTSLIYIKFQERKKLRNWDSSNLSLKGGAYVLSGVGDLYPQFCKVIEVLVFRSSYYLKLQQCKTDYFDSHYHSFSISFLPSYYFLSVHSLPFFQVLHPRKMCITSRLQFITLKQFIEVWDVLCINEQ